MSWSVTAGKQDVLYSTHGANDLYWRVTRSFFCFVFSKGYRFDLGFSLNDSQKRLSEAFTNDTSQGLSLQNLLKSLFNCQLSTSELPYVTSTRCIWTSREEERERQSVRSCLRRLQSMPEFQRKSEFWSQETRYKLIYVIDAESLCYSAGPSRTIEDKIREGKYSPKTGHFKKHKR